MLCVRHGSIAKVWANECMLPISLTGHASSLGNFCSLRKTVKMLTWMPDTSICLRGRYVGMWRHTVRHIVGGRSQHQSSTNQTSGRCWRRCLRTETALSVSVRSSQYRRMEVPERCPLWVRLRPQWQVRSVAVGPPWRHAAAQKPMVHTRHEANLSTWNQLPNFTYSSTVVNNSNALGWHDHTHTQLDDYHYTKIE